MEMTQLIELIYWMLMIYGSFVGVAFIIALYIIITGLRRALKKGITLDGEEITKPLYRDPDPAKTISKFANRGK